MCIDFCKRLWRAVLSALSTAPTSQTPPPSKENDSILIIGAGSTGLAVAQGLRKAGIPCIVCERHDSFTAQPRDWNMGLHWGADALQSLLPEEMWKEIRWVHVDPSKPPTADDVLKFLNAKSGELMTQLAVNHFHRLRRSKLRALLTRDVDVRFGKLLKDLRYDDDDKSVTAYFGDGTSISAKLVIGADGARSTLRQLVVGREIGAVRRLPYVATFVHARFNAERALFLREKHPLYLAGIHPNGFFSFFGMQDAADPSDPETWTFFFYISWYSTLEEQDKTAGWTNKQRLDQVKNHAKDFDDPVKSAFQWLGDDHPVWHMGLTEFDPGTMGDHWDNHQGRVTITGDAAHAMTYQRGQGLNHSVTDAANLVDAVKGFISEGRSQAAAISQYEEEVFERAGAEVRMSTTNTEMLHDWNKVMQSPVMTSGIKSGSQAHQANGEVLVNGN